MHYPRLLYVYSNTTQRVGRSGMNYKRWTRGARVLALSKLKRRSSTPAMRYSAYLQLDVKDPDFSISEDSISRVCWHPKAAKTGQNSKENKVAHLPILFPYSARLDLLWPYWGRDGRRLPSCQIGCQCQFAFYAIHICSKCPGSRLVSAKSPRRLMFTRLRQRSLVIISE